MERIETKMDRELLEALRRRAAEEGRGEYEVIEDAARLYLEHGRPIINELIERAKERRARAGLRALRGRSDADRRRRATLSPRRSQWRVTLRAVVAT